MNRITREMENRCEEYYEKFGNLPEENITYNMQNNKLF